MESGVLSMRACGSIELRFFDELSVAGAAGRGEGGGGWSVAAAVRPG